MVPVNDETPKHWQIISETLVAPCRIFDIYLRYCQHPCGNKGTFYAIKTSDWALSLPITPNNELVLVHQYRFAADLLSWEVPGGIINADESPIEAAMRELKEETGFTGQNPQIIGTCLPNPAILTNRAYFILIQNCAQTHSTSWDHHEEPQTQLIPLKEVFEGVHSGKIQNGVTLNALFALKLHLEQLSYTSNTSQGLPKKQPG